MNRLKMTKSISVINYVEVKWRETYLKYGAILKDQIFGWRRLCSNRFLARRLSSSLYLLLPPLWRRPEVADLLQMPAAYRPVAAKCDTATAALLSLLPSIYWRNIYTCQLHIKGFVSVPDLIYKIFKNWNI